MVWAQRARQDLVPVFMMCADDYLRVVKRVFDVNKWAQELKPGCLVDARLPITDRWAPARILTRAPAPFTRWYRVAFEGLPFRWCVTALTAPVERCGGLCVCVLIGCCVAPGGDGWCGKGKPAHSSGGTTSWRREGGKLARQGTA